MAGTRAGALKARETNKKKYGEDFYQRIGKDGGSVKSPLKGFGGNKELARKAGAIGGRTSKRVKKDK